MTSATFALSTVPLNVTSPLLAVTVTPVMLFFFKPSLIVPSSVLSGDGGGGGGSGFNVQLLVTDLMPSTALTDVSAFAFTV